MNDNIIACIECVKAAEKVYELSIGTKRESWATENLAWAKKNLETAKSLAV